MELTYSIVYSYIDSRQAHAWVYIYSSLGRSSVILSKYQGQPLCIFPKGNLPPEIMNHIVHDFNHAKLSFRQIIDQMIS